MAFRLLPFAPANMSRTLFSEALQFRPVRFMPPIATAFLQPVSISLNIPGLLSDIWESVLRAVPKKKTSHMKKRHRFMAGKALKDVKNLNKCPGCGQIKRAHLLCPHCVKGKIWRSLHLKIFREANSDIQQISRTRGEPWTPHEDVVVMRD
ncbi:unnamed protein product [Penicillium salamii]|uniref:Large ribosomal subunit protein bL32m n=1 Tax=Penicillium salamii TaxID=1612424 RepID=A0A9W4NXD0_9EURO|nr:unnamed protein product [Penicillium salamii]CAG8041970.1 unnamed protein product [Penicillium salamii]CAG8104978.1 unnamed protein product [Penicillium salamii]CAG8138343.1 unnamed protein product [Penicillium salamii]CAG8179159.1 unnamed protein product [Penicillium salamii]